MNYEIYTTVDWLMFFFSEIFIISVCEPEF